MNNTRLLFCLSILLSTVTSFAADSVEVIQCKSGDDTLSVFQAKKKFSVSLLSAMTREKIQKTFPGVDLSEEMMAMLLKQKPQNIIPTDYQTYDTLEMSDEIVRNGFKLAGKNIDLKFSRDTEEKVKVQFGYHKNSGSTTETRSSTIPFGDFASVDCVILSDIK